MATLTKTERFFEHAPRTAFFLETNVESLRDYLKGRGWLQPDETVQSATVAGEGNMNYIVRVATGARTFILKQSRPWVEKYCEIDAPFDRALVEAEFYELVRESPAVRFTPKLYWVDEDSRILCLEDLGSLSDFTNVYSGHPIQQNEKEQLCEFLSVLHRSDVSLRNREMRTLNHFHIFEFPFRPDNGFDLDRVTPGLQGLSKTVKSHLALLKRVTELGRIYLAEDRFLIHGDFFPGSWLRGTRHVMVIDPEFGFSGVREFDLGIMCSHLLISSAGYSLSDLAASYAQWNALDERLVKGFAGVEILRRLLGVAQLPIQFDLEHKRNLIEVAEELTLA